MPTQCKMTVRYGFKIGALEHRIERYIPISEVDKRLLAFKQHVNAPYSEDDLLLACDDLIGESVIKRALMWEISIQYNVSIDEGRNSANLEIHVEIMSYPHKKEILHHALLSKTWRRLTDSQRWDMVVAIAFNAFRWDVKLIEVEK